MDKHKTVQPLCQTDWPFLVKLNIDLPQDPTILFIGIYPKETKAYAHTTNLSTSVFSYHFHSVKKKNWKQSKCPTTGEWINGLWDVSTQCYLAMKKNELLIHSARTWRHFQSIVLSERKQTQETKYFISFILHSRKGKLCFQKADQWLGRGGN